VAAAAITVKLNQGSKEVGLRVVGTRDFVTHTLALDSEFKGLLKWGVSVSKWLANNVCRPYQANTGVKE
jgi:hypothetical protein